MGVVAHHMMLMLASGVSKAGGTPWPRPLQIVFGVARH